MVYIPEPPPGPKFLARGVRPTRGGWIAWRADRNAGGDVIVTVWTDGDDEDYEQGSLTALLGSAWILEALHKYPGMGLPQMLLQHTLMKLLNRRQGLAAKKED